MKIRELRIDFERDDAKASVWVECHNTRDCDALMRWLDMAGNTMNEWERIRADLARPPKASPSKDEDQQPREVQSPAPAEIRADRFRSQQKDEAA